MNGVNNKMTINDMIKRKRAKMYFKFEKKGDDKIVNRRIKKILNLWLKDGIYNCEECPKAGKTRFSSINGVTLENHANLKHPDYQPFICNLCGETFKRYSVRTAHIKKTHYTTILLKLKL
jgi:hypothetical protein